MAIVDSDDAAAMEGSSNSLNSHGGYCESSRATGSDRSLKMHSPVRTVPGGAADGKDAGAAAAETLGVAGVEVDEPDETTLLIEKAREAQEKDEEEDAIALRLKRRLLDAARRIVRAWKRETGRRMVVRIQSKEELHKKQKQRMTKHDGSHRQAVDQSSGGQIIRVQQTYPYLGAQDVGQT